MANSGSFDTSSYGSGNYNRYLNFSWSVQSQSTANNTTTISYTLKGAGGNTTSWQMSGPFKLIIDGQTVYSSSDRIQLKNGTVLKTGTFTMTHNSSGARSFSAYAEAAINSYSINCTGSGSWSLPNISRYPTMSSAPNFNDTDNPTITFSNPSQLYPIRCKIEAGGDTQLIIRDLPKTATSCTFQLTSAERALLYAKCPNSKTLGITFTVCAMSGNTELNASYVYRTMTVVNANPTFTAAYKDTNSSIVAVTENDQLIVQGQSTLQVNITNAAALKGASLTTATCVLNGTTYSGNITGSSYSFNIGVLNISSNATASVTVEDSRGNTTSTDLTIQMIAYYQPSAIITAERQNNFYSPTTVNVDANYASVDDKNTIEIKVRYKKLSDSSWSNYVTFQDNVSQVLTLDNNYDWILQVVLIDLYSTVTYNVSVSRGMPIVYFDRLLSSTGFNCFPDGEKGVYSEGLQIDSNICVGSQVLYDAYVISTLTSVTILSAYNYDLIDGMFGNLTLPLGYERAIRISAQISTSNANTAKVSLNNLETATGATYSNANYRKIITSDIMKVSDLELEPTIISSSRDGLNLELTNGGSATGNAYFYNITLHGYIVKSD